MLMNGVQCKHQPVIVVYIVYMYLPFIVELPQL